MYKCIDNKWKKTSRKKEYRESCEESRKSTSLTVQLVLGSKYGTIIWFASPWSAEFEKITNNGSIKAPHHSLYQHPPLHQAQNGERREGLWKKKGKAVAPERC